MHEACISNVKFQPLMVNKNIAKVKTCDKLIGKKCLYSLNDLTKINAERAVTILAIYAL